MGESPGAQALASRMARQQSHQPGRRRYERLNARDALNIHRIYPQRP